MKYLLLVFVLLLAGCAPSYCSIYRAPRHTERRYHQRQRINERDRQRAQTMNFTPLGWLTNEI